MSGKMIKFVKGNRVKYVSGYWQEQPNNPLWGGKYGYVKGTIKFLRGYHNSMVDVMWDNGSENTYYEKDLEIIKDMPDILAGSLDEIFNF